jgi:hypothetical protein
VEQWASHDYLDTVTETGEVDGGVDGLLFGVDFVGERLVVILLGEGDGAVDGVVREVDEVAGLELKGFVLAVELHLVPVPGVPVGTDEVVAVTRAGVAEVEVGGLDGVEVADPHPDPRGQLVDLHPPLFYAPAACLRTRVLLRAGSSRIIRWLPLVVMLAFEGEWIVMQVPFSSSEKWILNFRKLVFYTSRRVSSSASSK